jgi:hypothetical protein
MNDTDTITLKDAASRFGFTVGALRAEAERGRLTLYRVGRSLYTTPADVREMISQCRVEPKAPAFTVTRRAVNTSSETDRASLDLAQQVLLRLRNTSQNTSRPNIDPRRITKGTGFR